MSVTSIDKDVEQLTMVVTAEFSAPVERVWQIWADPRQLERWWGPPTYPATVTDHDLTEGGRVAYYMTSPEGEKYHGWWRIIEVDEPHGFQAEDGFADDSGEPVDDMPTNIFTTRLEALAPDATRMTLTSKFPSVEAMEKLVEMGMIEGLSAAMEQIDDLLADG